MVTLDRGVTRETAIADTTKGGNRRLIVRLEAGGKLIKIWPKGTREKLAVPIAQLWTLALQLKARQHAG